MPHHDSVTIRREPPFVFPGLAGIVNVTPDSFSGDGACRDAGEAVARVRRMIEDGARAVDIGAESTRPGATPLAPVEEWARLAPVLPEARRIAAGEGVALSLDTRHAETARRGLEIGVDWINDVGGFSDPAMVAAVREGACRLVVMHALGIPADPARHLPEDADPVAELRRFFEARVYALAQEGIPGNRLMLDPGIGFGKTARQSLALIAQAEALRVSGLPLLAGHSRKSFLSLFTSAPPQERDDLTLAFSWALALQGVAWLRVHNVRRHRDLFRTLGGSS